MRQLLSKEQVEKILIDLEELNSILDDNLTEKKEEVINKIDGMIELLEVALNEFER